MSENVAPAFKQKLSPLVSMGLAGDADSVAAVIEGLIDALGLAVAVSCGGNIAAADDMLTGVDGYLVECVARHAKLAAFMADCRQFRKEADFD